MSETNHVQAIKAVVADITGRGGSARTVYPRTPSCDVVVSDVYIKIRTPSGVRSATVAERAKMFDAVAAHTPDALMLIGTQVGRLDLWEVWGDFDVLYHLIKNESGPLPDSMGLPSRITWRDFVHHLVLRTQHV